MRDILTIRIDKEIKKILKIDYPRGRASRNYLIKFDKNKVEIVNWISVLISKYFGTLIYGKKELAWED